MGFWIQLGVSGFRMDAVPFVISTKEPPSSARENGTICSVRFANFSNGA
jgi:glycosidase